VKSPPKIKVSEDQTPISRPAFGPIQPCSPAPNNARMRFPFFRSFLYGTKEFQTTIP
jgi:hypothetical protein